MTKILAIRYSGLGDVVMLLQTLKKIKEKYSDAHITLLTDTSNKDMQYLSCGLIDNTITINRKVFKNRQVFASLIEIINVFKQVRQEFDICIDFQNFGETATVSYLANAKKKYGAPKKDKYNYGYTHRIKFEDINHRSQLFSRVAQVDDSLDFSELCLNEEALTYKKEVLTKLDSNKKSIGLNIGSTQESRRWSEKNFAKLERQLSDKYNVLVYLGPTEKQYRDAFHKDTVFIEDVNIIKLCGAIAIPDIFITNDTGPAHIAAALECKVVTLFSSGEDSHVGCLTNKKAFIRKEIINEITIEEVLTEVGSLEN